MGEKQSGSGRWFDALLDVHPFFMIVPAVIFFGVFYFATGHLSFVAEAALDDLYVEGSGHAWRDRAFPAEDAEGYVFAADPNGIEEQWLKDTYPELWVDGVRALTPGEEPWWSTPGAESPFVLVQYVDGVRYEGTEESPLSFDGRDPDVFPADTLQAALDRWSAQPDFAADAGGAGYAAYVRSSDAGVNVEVVKTQPDTEPALVLSELEVSSPEAALTYLSTAATDGERRVYPGEIESIVWFASGADGVEISVWDPQAEQWVAANAR